MARLSRTLALLIVLIPLLGLGIVARTEGAQATNRAAQTCFAETGACAEGAFLAYWQAHGGLAILGFPIDAARTSPDGLIRQYYERAILEWHPENRDPYRVLLTRLGADAAAGKPEAGATPAPCDGDCSLFTETSHTLRGTFKGYWQAHGGLPVFGFPLTEEFVETSPTDGQPYTVQYFERNRFEYHPEVADPAYQVLLGQLARERFNAVADQVRGYPTAQVPGGTVAGAVWTIDWGGPTPEMIGGRPPYPPYNCAGAVAPLAGVPQAQAVSRNTVLTTDGTAYYLGQRITGLSDLVAIGLGYAVGADGRAWRIGGLTPILPPQQEQGIANVIAVGGANMKIFLKQDGTVWFRNGDSPLTQAAGLNNIVAVAGGGIGDTTPPHGLALRGDGTVWTWSWDGNRTPQQVQGLTGVTAIAAGEGMSLALKDDGTVWYWWLSNAQNVTDWIYGPPTQLAGIGHVTAIGGAWINAYAVTDDGAMWTWWRSGTPSCSNGSPTRVVGLPPIVAVGQGQKETYVIAKP